MEMHYLAAVKIFLIGQITLQSVASHRFVHSRENATQRWRAGKGSQMTTDVLQLNRKAGAPAFMRTNDFGPQSQAFKRFPNSLRRPIWHRNIERNGNQYRYVAIHKPIGIPTSLRERIVGGTL